MVQGRAGGSAMAGPEGNNDQLPPVFLVVGPESGQKDPESAWHRKLLEAWLPLIRPLGPTVLLDRPESRLAFHARQAREAGHCPVTIQFLPVHRVYPVAGTRLLVATASDHVTAPDWPVGGDVRRRWSRTVPLVDTLITPVPATEDAFRDAGFRGQSRVVPWPCESACGNAERGPAAQGLELPFGKPVNPMAEPAWQEPDAGARGLSSRVWHRFRSWYYRFARPLVPARFHHALLRLFQAVKKRWGCRRAGLPGSPVAIIPGESEVTITRLDPVVDPSAVTECLLAHRRALGGRKDRTLVVEMPGPWEESVSVLADLARRMPASRARLVAVGEGTEAAKAFRHQAAWALAPGADRASMEWAQAMLALGVPLMAPGRGLSAPVGAAWPGIALAGSNVPASLPDDPEGMASLLGLRARAEELEKAFSRTLAVHSGSRAHNAMREMAREAAGRATPGFVQDALESAIASRAGDADQRAA